MVMLVVAVLSTGTKATSVLSGYTTPPAPNEGMTSRYRPDHDVGVDSAYIKVGLNSSLLHTALNVSPNCS